MVGLSSALRRVLRACTILIRDERIPKPLRWLGWVALLPVPGPFDEALLVLTAPVLPVFYRQHVQEAWGRAARAEQTS